MVVVVAGGGGRGREFCVKAARRGGGGRGGEGARIATTRKQKPHIKDMNKNEEMLKLIWGKPTGR